MKNINLPLLIVVTIIAILLAFLLFRGCNLPVTDNQRMIDSLKIERRKSDSVFFSILSLKQDSIVRGRFVIDSIEKAAHKTTKALEASKAQVAVLIAKSYVIPPDSIKQRLDNCDSIKREAIYLAENVSDYQRAQEALVNNQKDLLATMQRTSEVKDSAYNDVKGQLDFIIPKYSKLDYNYKKAEKKANKRFGIGVQAGYTYVTDKFRPVVSVGIHYSIIRF